MAEKMPIEDKKVSKKDVQKKRSHKHISPAFMFIVVAFSIAAGYLIGVYNYQIISAIGPIFGQKSFQGNIDLSTVQETYYKLASNFDGKLDMDKLIQGASRGLVEAAGDDYTIYMDPNEAKDFNNALSGNIGAGIGAEIGKKNNKIIIVRALKDNPAEKVGLNANDIILSVNDESTTNWTVDDTVDHIRGDEGTTVKIIIQRGDEIKEFTITRQIINNPSVEYSVSNGIGILTIYRFDNETGSLAKIAAKSFIKESVKGIIVDLRGNGGGFVDAAKEVAGLWLDKKVVVVEKSGKIVTETVITDSDAIIANIPTVVLVNSGTASASEIVAGALQEYGKAKLVGEKTFGKGSVQKTLDLSGGSLLKVTIAKWYTPNGRNINKEGILPDIEAELTQSDIDNSIDPQMNAAIKALNL